MDEGLTWEHQIRAVRGGQPSVHEHSEGSKGQKRDVGTARVRRQETAHLGTPCSASTSSTAKTVTGAGARHPQLRGGVGPSS